MHNAENRACDLHSIPLGTELHLQLREGSELFCRRGQLQIISPQQACSGGMPELAVALSPGQGWRAGADLRIRIRALSQATAKLELWQAPMPQGHAASEERTRPQGWTLAGWLRSLRRGPRAA